MGLELISDSSNQVSMRPEDLAVANEQAKEIGQRSRAQFLAVAVRRLLASLAMEEKFSNAELQALKDFNRAAKEKWGQRGAAKLPQARIAISVAERKFVTELCPALGVDQVNFYGYAVHSFKQSADGSRKGANKRRLT